MAHYLHYDGHRDSNEGENDQPSDCDESDNGRARRPFQTDSSERRFHRFDKQNRATRNKDRCQTATSVLRSQEMQDTGFHIESSGQRRSPQNVRMENMPPKIYKGDSQPNQCIINNWFPQFQTNNYAQKSSTAEQSLIEPDTRHKLIRRKAVEKLKVLQNDRLFPILAPETHLVSRKALSQLPKVRLPASKSIIVGAIDFGTTYSGWAFSFLQDFKNDPTKAEVKNWYSGTIITEKTPTCLLINPDGLTFCAFGYEAENKYQELTQNGNHKKYYFFRSFKMMLHKRLGEKLDRDAFLHDEMGKPLLAMQVFSLSIEYLVSDVMETLKKRQTGVISAADICWVLTVPAIWTDSAKQFMREAAIEAGIATQNLTIALEAEVASLYCRHLQVDGTVGQNHISIASFPKGTKYLILDAGGGTIDITVHEIADGGCVKEIHAACGGGWGGTMVDKRFECLLIVLVGYSVYKKFKVNKTEDWLDLWRDFDAKKRTVQPDSKSQITMHLPQSLRELFQTTNEKSIEESLEDSKYFKSIKIVGDKIRFGANIFKSLFKSSIKKTVEEIKSVMRHPNTKNVKAILMVGGYSESPMLQAGVKSSFPNINLVIPIGATSVILRGALIYGHSPRSITERILKYTYGIRSRGTFREGLDPENKRVKTERGDECTDHFSKHVEKNQIVKVGEAQVSKIYTPVELYLKKLTFPMYASDLLNPQYTDEEGCRRIGQLTISIKDPDDDWNRKVLVHLTFSGTEIIVSAIDKKTGEKTSAALDFLG